MVKNVIVGLDSACWEILDPWIDRGELPTFKKLKEEGVYGDLKSTFPFLTAPAWKCYSTGKNPGKLGVFHWFNFDKKTKKLKVNNSNSFDGKEFWDYLSDEKLRCGIINMPLTFPPKKILGFMVSGIHAFNWSEYTYPKNLKKYLEKEFNYTILPKHPYTNLEKVIPEAKNLIEKRFDVCFDMISHENFDFLQITIFVIDSLHHFYWNLLKNKNSPLLDIWKVIDKKISELISIMDPENLILVSDHGITGIKAHFKANELLEKEGYLYWEKKKRKKKFTISKLIDSIGIKRDFISKLFTIIPPELKNLISNETIIKKTFGEQFPDEKGEFGITAVLANVDWERTKAIVIGEGLLYIFDRNISENEKNELVNKLKNVRNPHNNEIILDIKSKNSIYWGKYLDIAPDFCLAPRKGYYISDKLSPNRTIIDIENGRWKAYHKIEGLFLAYGKVIKKGKKIKNAKIYDIAPTILHMSDLPIPNDMDGRVLTEIFEDGSELAKRKPRHVDLIYYEKEKIREGINKLKKLEKI